MIFLLADPSIVYLPMPDPPYDLVERLLRRMTFWYKLQREFDIEIAMTQECRNALSRTLKMTYSASAIQSAISREIVPAIFPFLDSLLAATTLDPLLEGVDALPITRENRDYIQPPNYLNQESDELRYAFYNMLWRVVVAREHLENPPHELSDTAVLTAFNDNREWYDDYLRNVFIIVGRNNKSAMKTPIVENLPVIDIDETRAELKELLEKHPRREFNSLLHTVQEAVAVHPDVLYLSKQGKNKAQRSSYSGKYLHIFRLIIGLAEIWLPAYEKGGQKLANHRYKEVFHADIADGYGESTMNDPYLSNQLVATFHGEDKYAVRHIKLSDAANVFRIHFQEQQMEDGSYRLLLGWIGRHPKTKLFGN